MNDFSEIHRLRIDLTKQIVRYRSTVKRGTQTRRQPLSFDRKSARKGSARRKQPIHTGTDGRTRSYRRVDTRNFEYLLEISPDKAVHTISRWYRFVNQQEVTRNTSGPVVLRDDHAISTGRLDSAGTYQYL